MRPLRRTHKPAASAPGRARVLVISNDELGESMAGPAIRALEIGRQLHRFHSVSILTPTQLVRLDETDRGSADETVRPTNLRTAIASSDVVVASSIGPRLALAARLSGCRLIYDAYDPVVLEMLEAEAHLGFSRRKRRLRRHVTQWRVSMRFCDALVCASERQRDLLLGALTAIGRVTTACYTKDPALRSLIDVVPFGLPPDSPRRSGSPLRETFGLRSADFVLVWGGGIWEWFDPLTLVRAVARISRRRDDIKLVFLGVAHPKPGFPQHQIVERTVALAREMGVLDKYVFINWGWVPYAERGAHLLDANVGVTISRAHVEGRFAFRTRLLDYLWCSLPLICTSGDWAADLVHERHLGEVVAPGDVGGLVDAIERLADNATLREGYSKNAAEVRAEMSWPAVSKPLIDLIQIVLQGPDRRGFTPTELACLVNAWFAARAARSAA